MSVSYNSYLYKCDYIYKHKLKSHHSVASLERVNLFISLPEFNKDIDPFSIIKSTEAELQTKAFFLFYTCFILLPFVKYIKKKDRLYFIIKLSFSGNKHLKNFQFYFNDVSFFFYNYLLVNSQNKVDRKNLVCNVSFFSSYGLKYSLKSLLDTLTVKNLNAFFQFIIKK